MENKLGASIRNSTDAGLSSFSRLRPVLALGVICVLAELAFAVVNVLAVPAFVAKELNMGAMVGVIMSAFLLSEALGRPALGALSDRIGRKPLIVFGPLLSGAAALLLVKAPGIGLILMIRIVDGIGAAAFWPAIFAAVGDSTEKSNRSSAMGMLNVAYMVGLALGPMAGGWINGLAGSPGKPVYHAAFYLAAALFAGAALMALLFVPAKAFQGTASSSDAERFTGVSSMIDASRRVWKLLVIAFFTFLGIGLLIPTVELYALDKFGIDQKTFGSLFLVPAVVIALSAVPLGRLGDRWGRLKSIKAGLLLCSASLLAVPAVHSYYVLAAGAIIVGLGFLLAFPAWMALVADVTSEEERGSVLGAAGMAQGIGAIAGAVIGGVLYHLAPANAGVQGAVGSLLSTAGIHQHDAPVYLAGALLALSLVLTVILVSEQKPQEL